MLRQSRVWAFMASPAQKLQGLRMVYSKKFSRATFFCFLGHLAAGKIFVKNKMLELFFSPSYGCGQVWEVCSKNFSRATFFCFLGHLHGGQLFELFAHETNLKKKSSVNQIQITSHEIRNSTP